MGPVRIDLHTHSTASDGTEAPAQVVAAAAAAGLDVVALTDHDTTAGWAEAEAAATEHGIALVRGTEVSARAAGISIHLLSYLQDPAHSALTVELDKTRDARVGRARAIVELLAQDYPITWDDVVTQSQGAVVLGRPHIADALVARGHVPDRTAAFQTILHWRGGYYRPHEAPPPIEGVKLIVAAGGVPIIAHPGARGPERAINDRRMAELVKAGLFGLELDHRDNSPQSRERLTRIAAQYGLVTTGSSDYHGAGKPNQLGENTTSPEVYAAIVAKATGSQPFKG